MKTYSWFTLFRSFADEMSVYLKQNGIRYERSGCGTGYYFSIRLTDEQVEMVNQWIDENSITEQ